MKNDKTQGGITKAESSDLAPTTSTVSAPSQHVKHGEVPSIEITLRQAKELVDCFGGHDAEISIIERPAAWADYPDGLYAYFSEYPDEGSMYLGPTEVDYDLAQNGDAGTQAAPEEVRNQALEEAAQVCDSLGGDIDMSNVDEAKLCANSLAHEIRALKTPGGAA